jgi:hypothetical protein
MPGARDNLAKIRGNVGRSAALAFGQAGSREDDSWSNHAGLRQVRLTEEYRVTQEISKNPKEDYDEQPRTGRIELSIPYDGHRFFPGEAREDVRRRLGSSPGPGEMAVIGQLALEDFGGEIMGLPEPRESVPVKVRVTDPRSGDTDGDADVLGHLTADRWTCMIEHTYVPGTPGAFPARLKVDLFDPDSLDLPDLDLESEQGRERIGGLTERITEKIRRQMSVRNPIILRIVACLTVPRRSGDTPQPRVTKMTIGWPVITSLRTVSLQVGDVPDEPTAEITYKRKTVRYNPVTRCLEWEGPRMVEKPGAHHDVVYFETPPMLLTIQQPGDLYQEDSLTARAEITVPGYLMSGLAARLKELGGPRKVPDPIPAKITRVHVNTKLKLDDAFTSRLFSPYQHLFFDEIIPDEMRITDIRTALRDLGFEELEPWRVGHSREANREGQTTFNWLLAAYRREGPHRMVLWISVEGRKFETEREQMALGGGRKHTRTMESGDLSIFIWGTLPGDHDKLNRQMNALQASLRERYERVRQHA